MVLHLSTNHIDRLEKRLASIESDTIGCLAYQFKCLGRLRADVDRTGYRCNGKRNSLTISVKGTTIPASGVEKR